MNTLTRRSLLAVAVVAATPVSVAVADEDVDAVLDRINEKRAKIKTLKAPFKQTRVIGLLASKVKSNGRLTMVRPDRLRWDLLEPDEVTYWVGPEGLAMKNEDGVTKISKASAGRFASVLEDLMTMLGGDMRQLEKRYAMRVAEADEGETRLVMKPKDKRVKKFVTRLELTLDDADLVRGINIFEKGGDKSRIRFGKFKLNEKVPPKDMKPPED